MAQGPGKYDDELTDVRTKTGAMNAILSVLDGRKGPGFSAQLTQEHINRMPKILRMIADQIEEDAKEIAQ
jgi:hypothetical protein